MLSEEGRLQKGRFVKYKHHSRSHVAFTFYSSISMVIVDTEISDFQVTGRRLAPV